MKVSPINVVNNTSFKGLWGVERSEVFSTTDDGVSIFRTKNYYPFLDEPQGRVDSIIRECKRNDVNISSIEGGANNRVTTVVNCYKLPFTEKEFEAYQSSLRLIPEKKNLIVKTLQEFDLTKFLKESDILPPPKKSFLRRIFNK